MSDGHDELHVVVVEPGDPAQLLGSRTAGQLVRLDGVGGGDGEVGLPGRHPLDVLLRARAGRQPYVQARHVPAQLGAQQLAVLLVDARAGARAERDRPARRLLAQRQQPPQQQPEHDGTGDRALDGPAPADTGEQRGHGASSCQAAPPLTRAGLTPGAAAPGPRPPGARADGGPGRAPPRAPSWPGQATPGPGPVPVRDDPGTCAPGSCRGRGRDRDGSVADRCLRLRRPGRLLGGGAGPVGVVAALEEAHRQRLGERRGEGAEDDQDEDVRRGQRAQRRLDAGRDREARDDDGELAAGHQRAARPPAALDGDSGPPRRPVPGGDLRQARGGDPQARRRGPPTPPRRSASCCSSAPRPLERHRANLLQKLGVR
ncbi:hypothetical protein SVIOM342S_09565 [Streptomyces violaceorubidus]